MTKYVIHYKISNIKGYGDIKMFRLNNKGQALVEYVLIIALISVIIIGIINTFGGALKDAITKTSCSISGQNYKDGDKSGEGYCVAK